eukprot:scaffold4307_cov67-Phaeocystis_antarctica.AAC.3
MGGRRAVHHPWSAAHTWARGGARNPLQTSSPPLSVLFTRDRQTSVHGSQVPRARSSAHREPGSPHKKSHEAHGGDATAHRHVRPELHRERAAQHGRRQHDGLAVERRRQGHPTVRQGRRRPTLRDYAQLVAQLQLTRRPRNDPWRLAQVPIDRHMHAVRHIAVASLKSISPGGVAAKPT